MNTLPFASRNHAYKLFGGPDLRELLKRRESDVFHRIDALSDNELTGSNCQQLMAEFIRTAQVEPPSVNLDEAYVFENSRQFIDVSKDPRRLNQGRAGSEFVEGQVIGVAFPIEGNAMMLAYKPVTFGFSTEDAGVDNKNVQWYVEGAPSIDPTQLRVDQDTFSKALKKAVESVASSIVASNLEIEQKIRAYFAAKISDARKRHEAVQALGLPMKPIEEKQAPKQFEKHLHHDVFISHASADKNDVARPLKVLLESLGCSVWLDETALEIGDSLRVKIDQGLKNSRFGVLVLSPAFIERNWPQYELDALLNREMSGTEKVILPIRHNLKTADINKYSGALGMRLSRNTADGLEGIAKEIADLVKREKTITAHS